MGKVRQQTFLASLTRDEQRWLLYYWPLWGRPSQLPPTGDWRVWLLMAGRGFGKTRAGAEWVRWLAESRRARHIALEIARMLRESGPHPVLAEPDDPLS